MEDHVAHLKLVFEVLVQYKAFSTTNKFSFAKPNIEYLGHIIWREGVSTDSTKVEAMVNWA